MKRSGSRPTNQDCEIEAAITALEILKECGKWFLCFVLLIDYQKRSKSFLIIIRPKTRHHLHGFQLHDRIHGRMDFQMVAEWLAYSQWSYC